MKALYIMSSPRGGSTLLSLALGRHSQIANLGEVSFIPKLLSLHEDCTCKERLSECPEWSNVFDSLCNMTGVDMRKTPYALHLDDVMKYKGGTGKIDHNHQKKWRMLRSKIRGAIDTILLKYQPEFGGKLITLPSIKKGANNTIKLYEAASTVWDKDVVIDASKLPRKAVHLYKQQPENVRILHLTRDSRGVCSSRKSHMDLEFAAKRWNYYHSTTIKLLDRWVSTEHRKQLKYENFVSDPKKHLQDLCQWLEVPYSEDILDFNNFVTEHSAGGNPTRFKFSEGIRPVDEKWKEVLTTQDINLLDSINSELNQLLGY